MAGNEPAQLFPYYRSPAAIRGEVFTVRIRGLDPDEVHEYLELLADQVHACETERAELLEEIDGLRRQVAQLGGRLGPQSGSHEASPEAVVVLSQAQQVADQLVEESVARARDLICAAHEQQREILEAAHRAAEAAAREAAQLSARNITTYLSTSAPEVEYARRFTRVAQVQLRSVLEALCEQVEQLGQVSRLWQQSPLATYAVEDPLGTEACWDARVDALPAQATYRPVDPLRD